MRRTDKGLKSSRGAPRANQDLVFGNRRLFTWASDASRVLFTGELPLPPGVAQPRQVVSDGCPDLINGSSSTGRASVSDNNPTTPWEIRTVEFPGPQRAKASSKLAVIASHGARRGSMSSRGPTPGRGT